MCTKEKKKLMKKSKLIKMLQCSINNRTLKSSSSYIVEKNINNNVYIKLNKKVITRASLPIDLKLLKNYNFTLTVILEKVQSILFRSHKLLNDNESYTCYNTKQIKCIKNTFPFIINFKNLVINNYIESKYLLYAEKIVIKISDLNLILKFLLLVNTTIKKS